MIPKTRVGKVRFTGLEKTGPEESISQLLKIWALTKTFRSYTKKYSGPTVNISDSELFILI